MNRIVIPWLLGLIACGSATTAEQTLVAKAISGEEETLVGSGFESENGAPLPFGRECDATGTFEQLFEGADQDGDGQLGAPESTEVEDSFGPPPPFFHFLAWVYDADDSHSLEESERIALLDDHTLRCEAIHDRLLEDFDADGDGTLSESELDEARECAPKPPKMNHPPQGGGHPEVPPPVLREFDADGSGDLSAEEAAAARSEIREQIRSGEPPVPPEALPE